MERPNKQQNKRKPRKPDERAVSRMTAAMSRGGDDIDRPPQLSSEIRITKRIRFVNGTFAGVTTFTVSDLLNLYVVALTATTSARLWRSVRLIKLEAWGEPPALGTQSTASLSICGIGVGPENYVSDIASGVKPSHVKWMPVLLAQNGLWQQTGQNENLGLFTVACPATGCTLDLTLEAIFADAEDAAVAGPVPAAAAPGRVYMTALDGIGGNYVPVDYTNLP